MNVQTRSSGFTEYLTNLKENKAAMAILRRAAAFSPGEYPPQYQYVVPFLKEGEYDLPFFLASSLFALHPELKATGNFGDSFRKLAAAVSSESIELRFNSLIQCHTDDLQYHLRNAVSLFSSKGIAVNYEELFRAIKNWNHPDRFVQRQWARSFWKREEKNENGNEQNEQKISIKEN
ncbi:MAG: type I-E CRISPR-associated protein Cse2/CasB [Ignavibacteriaceae bacterium]|nr:type I-E CRISPR-associated protein Cse2/CasB [Ignavibacteriaceae bacterium]